MPKMGAALKAPPTSRGEVQFGEGNPRTASGVAPDPADVGCDSESVLYSNRPILQ